MTCYDAAFQLVGVCMLYVRCFSAYTNNSLGFDPWQVVKNLSPIPQNFTSFFGFIVTATGKDG